jgi:hypothetical protein
VCLCPQPDIIALWVNQESRSVALEHYERRGDYVAVAGPDRLCEFVSFEIDRFFFDLLHFFRDGFGDTTDNDWQTSVPREDAARIKHVIIGIIWPEICGFWIGLTNGFQCSKRCRPLVLRSILDAAVISPRLQTSMLRWPGDWHLKADIS